MIWSMLGRLFTDLLGYCLAAIAAGFFIAMAEAAPIGTIDPGVLAFVVGIFGTIASIFTGMIAAPVAVLAIAVAEIMRLRSWVYFALAGAVAGAAPYVMAVVRTDSPEDIGGPGLGLLCAAGIVAGLVYWLVAGRSSGIDLTHQPPLAGPGA